MIGKLHPSILLTKQFMHDIEALSLSCFSRRLTGMLKVVVRYESWGRFCAKQPNLAFMPNSHG